MILKHLVFNKSRVVVPVFNTKTLSHVRLRMLSTEALYKAKGELRKDLKHRLASMTPDERVQQSNIIAQNLFSLPEYQSSVRVCLYLNMTEEVQTKVILTHLLNNHKHCFIPQYIGPVMKMVQLESLSDYEALPETRWKIKQPADDDVRPDALDTGGLDVILMPGLGFTTAGDRIGRGKGYYDNYLQKCYDKGFYPKTIGLSYRQQLCDSIPLTENDKKLDLVLWN